MKWPVELLKNKSLPHDDEICGILEISTALGKNKYFIMSLSSSALVSVTSCIVIYCNISIMHDFLLAYTHM